MVIPERGQELIRRTSAPISGWDYPLPSNYPGCDCDYELPAEREGYQKEAGAQNLSYVALSSESTSTRSSPTAGDIQTSEWVEGKAGWQNNDGDGDRATDN